MIRQLLVAATVHSVDVKCVLRKPDQSFNFLATIKTEKKTSYREYCVGKLILSCKFAIVFQFADALSPYALGHSAGGLHSQSQINGTVKETTLYQISYKTLKATLRLLLL